MSNLYMPISSVIISLILLIVYLSKERAKIKENEVYLIMLFCILFDSLFVSAIFVNAGVVVTLTKILNRCDFVMLVVWSSCLCRYTHTVLHKKDTEHYRRKQIFRRIISAVAHVQTVLIWILGIEAICEDGICVAITGPTVVFTFASCAFNLLLTLIVIVHNIKKITKQIIPVFIFLGIAGLCALAYYLDPSISGVSMGLTIVNLTMYFTIENPDVQMLEQVNLAKEQALRASQAKTDFLSSMSHEIRTPINAIMGLSECIQNDSSLQTAKEDARDIMSASENLLELVNGILDISKIEAGRMEIVNKEYDLTDMAEKLSKLIKARIGEKPIELRMNISGDIPGVLFGDEGKLRQIMTNFLTNAVKYTDNGHIDFNIECVNTDNTASLTISVADTGRGIKEDEVDKLFDKFKRLDEDKNSNIEGTGLGLAITKQFAEMLGGTIEVQSTYGMGSTFTLRVSQEIRSLEHKSAETVTETKREYPGRKVLVVDDIAMNLMVAKRLLEVYQVIVDTASSGEECIEKCKAYSYDLLLLDDMMPNMSGSETFEKLKELPEFSMPVVAFTANAIDGMRENYLKAGYVDYLSKPISTHELTLVLEKLLG